MPVLAQSQVPTQSGCSGCLAPITVTSQQSSDVSYQSSYLSYPALYNSSFFMASGATGCAGCGSGGGNLGAKIFLGAVGAGGATGGAIGVSTTIALGEQAGALTTEYWILEAGISLHELGGAALVGTGLGMAGGVVIGGAGILLYEMSQIPSVPGYGAPTGPNDAPVVISPY
jgi:hypothetical protein